MRKWISICWKLLLLTAGIVQTSNGQLASTFDSVVARGNTRLTPVPYFPHVVLVEFEEGRTMSLTTGQITLASDTGVFYPLWEDWNSDQGSNPRPIFVYNEVEYVDTIRTEPFFVKPGDTLSYVRSVDFIPTDSMTRFDDWASRFMLQDSIMYNVDLIDPVNNAVALHLDTLMFHKADSTYDILVDLCSQYMMQGNSYLRYIVMPSELDPSHYRLRVTITYFGEVEKRWIERSDVWSAKYPTMDEFFKSAQYREFLHSMCMQGDSLLNP